MDKGTRFFSICDKRKWLQGCWEGVAVSDEGIALSQKRGYIFEKKVKLDEHFLGFRVKELITYNSQYIYVINDKNELWNYSIEVDELSYSCDMNELENKKNPKFRIWADIILFLEESENKIYIKSISQNRVLRVVDFDQMNFIPVDFCINDNGLMYLINDYGNLLMLDIPSDKSSLFTLGLDIEITEKNQIYCNGNMGFVVRTSTEVWEGYNADPEDLRLVMLCGSNDAFYYNGDFITESNDGNFSSFYNHSEYDVSLVLRKEADENLYHVNEDRLFSLANDGKEINVWRFEPQYIVPTTDNFVGVYFSKSFDSGMSHTIWHRFGYIGDIPGNTNIEISYYAFEDEVIVHEDKSMKVNEFLDSSEVSTFDKEIYLSDKWINTVLNGKDGLFFNTEGRYLIIKVNLIGMVNDSPSISRIRVYYNRETYLQYLPEVFQDERGKDFLERFLSIYEVFLGEMEERIDNMAMYFDPDLLEGEMLEWIAEWLKVRLIKSWDSKKTRAFIKLAPELYKIRGTRVGIEKLLEFCTGYKPVIIEYFEVTEFDINEIYPKTPYSVTVLIRSDRFLLENEMAEIIDLLTDEVPVYLTLKVIQLQRFSFLDRQTFLGVNSYVSEFINVNLNNENTMAYNRLENDTISNLQNKWISNLNLED